MCGELKGHLGPNSTSLARRCARTRSSPARGLAVERTASLSPFSMRANAPVVRASTMASTSTSRVFKTSSKTREARWTPRRSKRAFASRVKANGISVAVDRNDDEEECATTSTSERLEQLLRKAAEVPVSVRDIEDFYPYDLDTFQVEATESLLKGSSVVVSAPTGSGKTLVGETAILTALARGEKAIYTTPLKALSNQKLREFQKTFGKRRCGLKTGDVDINGDADVMIMTTEILRNMLYSSAAGGRDDDRLSEVSIIVLDEVHYLSDPSRGTVWEETVIYCPSRIQLLCLSATVGNPEDLSGWIEEVHGPCETVVSTYRPVPLTWQYSMKPSRMYPGLGPLVNFKGTKLHQDLRPFTREGLQQRNNDWTDDETRRQGPASRESDRILRRRFVPHVETTVQQLIASDMIPAVWFIFSRKGCDQSVNYLVQAGGNLVTRAERDQIDAALREFSKENKSAVRSEMVEPLRRGVASHHAGLLPAWKGLVEKLFQQGLIKVVFATETLAAGVNMPARCSVLSALSKRDDQGPRLLTSNEFMQMAGRAGRRGYDTVGHVVCCQSPFEGPEEAFELVISPPENLKSQFSISYGMVLNLLQGRSLQQVKGIVERSFGNYLGGKARAVRERELHRVEVQIGKLAKQIEETNEDEEASEWKRFMKLDERLKEEKRLLKILLRQATEMQACEVRETLTSEIERMGVPVVVAIDVGDTTLIRRKERRTATIALFEDDSLKVEGEDIAGEWRLQDLDDDNSPSLDELFGGDSEDESQIDDDFVESLDKSYDASSRRLITAAIVEAVPAVKIAPTASAIGKPYPMGEFTALGSDSVWYRFYSDRVKSICIRADALRSADIEEAGAPPSSSSLRWIRANGGGLWKADVSKKGKKAIERIPTYLSGFKSMEQSSESLEYINAQKLQIQKTREEINSLKNVANLRTTAKQQKKREIKLKKLKQKRDNIEDRIKEYSAAGWEEFLRVVDILIDCGAMEAGTLKLLEFGEICADLRGENELWLGMAMSSPQVASLDVATLAGFAGALCMDNRPATCFYGPSQELSAALEEIEPAMGDLQYLQSSAGIDVPISLSFEVAALVESWACGTSWDEIRHDTTLDEGDIARLFRRTAELLAQIPRVPHLPEILKANAKKANDVVNRPPISDLS